MDLWFTEQQTPNLALSFRIRRTLLRQKTDFQDLAVVETEEYGKMLVLDGCVMTTDRDEFIYHEMMTHVPLCTHPDPRRVLVVGGGDGGVIREVCKHPSVEQAVLCEIDPQVIEASRQFFPQISSALTDPRVQIVQQDGNAFVHQQAGEFDVILCDSTDPVGPGKVLFSRDFYQAVRDALKPEGIFVAQGESPFLHSGIIRSMLATLRDLFPIVRYYWTVVPTYPGAFWGFVLASRRYDPLQDQRQVPLSTRYYTPAIHRAAFALPAFAAEELGLSGQ